MNAPDQPDDEAPSEADARVQQAERLLLSGELLVSLSHEVNNALMGILGNVGILQQEALPPSARDITENIMFSGKRLHSLLQSMLGLARGGMEETQSDINAVLSNIVELVRPLARERHVALEYVAAATTYVQASPLQIQQISLNLLVNAVQAAPEHAGVVRLQVQSLADSVIMLVQDNGPGVPDAIRTRIFEPFFSTKPEGVGTGLGLSIASTAAREVGGTLELADARRGSTLFRVRLPRAHTNIQQRQRG